MSILQYLSDRGLNTVEGNCQNVPEQVEQLIEITKNAKTLMEIGFNGGSSAEIFLQNNPYMTMVSFDLGEHNYVLPANEYIDAQFPDRHKLILGDSAYKVPEFTQENPNTTFDVIFIDGGHFYNFAKSDMENSFHLSHKDTIVIMDDTMYREDWHAGWNDGPTWVWTEFLNENKIVQLGRSDYYPGRGMCWGKFCNR
jgi:predicted O-methyltransferase YrrM